jgi:hypothetical protein
MKRANQLRWIAMVPVILGMLALFAWTLAGGAGNLATFE